MYCTGIILDFLSSASQLRNLLVNSKTFSRLRILLAYSREISKTDGRLVLQKLHGTTNDESVHGDTYINSKKLSRLRILLANSHEISKTRRKDDGKITIH